MKVYEFRLMMILLVLAIFFIIQIGRYNERQDLLWKQELVDARKTSEGFGVEGIDYFVLTCMNAVGEKEDE